MRGGLRVERFQVSGVRCQEGCSKYEELSGYGLEKTLELKVPERERRRQVAEESIEYSVNVTVQRFRVQRSGLRTENALKIRSPR